MQKKRIILSSGGTGGHLFPAQAVARELMQEHDVLFVGGNLSQNRFFDREEFAFKDIPCATFSFRKPLDVLRKAPLLAHGVLSSLKILRNYSPDIVVGFGSYFTLPLLLAASIARVPFILHEQNAVPGKVNKLLSRAALETAITFSSSSAYFKGKTTIVKYPLRKEICSGPEQADLDYFGLKKDLPIILVFGGSQGGRGLNSLFLEAIDQIHLPVQILHFTGNDATTLQAKSIYTKLNVAHVVKEFEPEIHRALKIATLAVTRAGAGTVVELMAANTPAILIPFPFAAEDHQTKNAAHFVDKAGGGSCLQEKETTGAVLASEINRFLQGEACVKKNNLFVYATQNQCRTLHDTILEHITIKRRT